MNGIERITQRIRTDAQAEIQQILNQAQEEADRIAERYRRQGAVEREELKERNDRAAAEQEERLVSAAQMEARKMILSTKQEMLEQAYARALEKLCALSEGEESEEAYIDILATLVERASSTGREQVIFSEEDRKRVGRRVVDKANEAVGKKFTLARQTREIGPGLILRDKNVEVNCTFETLIRLEKSRITGEVVKKLFPPDEEASSLESPPESPDEVPDIPSDVTNETNGTDMAGETGTL